jgi:hypothetical protein
LWMAVSERGISEPTMYVHVIVGSLPIVYQYFINSSKDTTKMKKSCSGLIWHLHTTHTIYFYTTQRIRWSD